MRHLAPNIDAAVVGGGVAGLTTAALLADAGKRVALFERSGTIGGRAITDVESGFHLNLGPHAWYVGSPGTRVLAQLGIALKGGVPKPAGAFAVRAGRPHTLPIGFVSLLTTNLLGVPGKLETARFLARAARIDTAAIDEMTFAEWLERELHDERAREVINMFVRVAMYADAPRLMSAGASLAALQMVLRDNVAYLDGGWQSIVNALRAKAMSGGVHIVTSSPVREVLHDAGVMGLKFENGDIVPVANVVLAVAPSVARQLVPKAPSTASSQWDGVPSKAACLDVGLFQLPKPVNTLAFGVDEPLYYSVHSATAALAPEGGAVIHVAKYLDPAATSNAEHDRQQLEALLDLFQPGWRSHVAVQRYLPAMTVTNAIPLASSGGLKGRSSVVVRDVPGLFLAGDWVGSRGTLAGAAVASAAHAAQFVIDRTSHHSTTSARAGAVA